MTSGRAVVRSLAILGGIAVGTLAAFSADAIGTRTTQPDPVVEREIPLDVAAPIPPRPQRDAVMLVWSPHGLPRGIAPAVRRMPGVEAVAIVHARLEWISETRSQDSVVIDRPEPGFAIPFDVAGITPRAYARFLAPSERPAVNGLGRREMLLASTSAELRRGAAGMSIEVEGRRRRVVGTISDAGAGGYEALVRRRDLAGTGKTNEFLLALIDSIERRPQIDRRMRTLMAGAPFRTRLQGETPYLRYGDAVLPQMLIKRSFGEFAAAPHGDGTVTVDPRWVRRNVVSRKLPLIGVVRCHRLIVPELQRALDEVVAQGLSFAVDQSQYAGCFGPRFINRDPSGRLSHHAWAMAIDLNAASNPFGARPTQDRRLVEIMERHGFTWGGRWLIPDGMHFEWRGPH